MSELVRPTWMTNAMFREWREYYLDAGGTGVTGSEERATEQFRASKNYERYFPGIKREDGMVRYATDPEATYFGNLAAFRTAVQSVDVNPALLEGRYVDLIKGDVAPNEFSRRLSSLQSRVISQSDSIREWYATHYGRGMTNAGMIASLMDEKLGADILNENITMAEIGGEASQRNFNLTTRFVDLLADQGMDRAEAQNLFGSAEQMVPMLGALAARHGDPDDTFDITEYAEAMSSIQDPTQRQRIDRLVAQEKSSFTGGKEEYRRSRTTGGVEGLSQT